MNYLEKGTLIDGWYVSPEVTLWIKTESGENILLKDILEFEILVELKTLKGERFLREFCERGIFERKQEIIKTDVWTNVKKKYIPLSVKNYTKYRSILKQADFFDEHIEYYNTEILEIQRYYLAHDLFPLCRVEVEFDSSQYLLDIKRVGEFHYPDFSIILIKAKYGIYKPIGKENPVLISDVEGNTYEIASEKKEFLEELNHILERCDPDVIYSVKGDEKIFPTIFRWSNELKFKTLLDREKFVYRRNPSVRKRSFVVYGRPLSKVTPFPLFGRLHIDKGVSFFQQESKIEGIFEIARHSRLSIQKLARSSPGSAMSAMEDEKALEKGYAIPRIKGSPPHPRPLSVLMKTDQGGLSFRPPKPGVYESVLELDFRSLYPNIMRYHNISGETINCTCCIEDETARKVPYTPYHTCSKRSGIVGDTISILLDRRDELIELLSQNPEKALKIAFTNRSDAIKWCLVTSFGYTGYKNAKYGRREAHEAITAWGRECLLTAKEIAEKRGYTFLHGLTDSLWLWNEGQDFSTGEIKETCEAIYRKIKIPIIHEATYSFLIFPESKVKKGQTVATRYYARNQNGTMKIRGAMMRKSDTPKIIYKFQEELFNLLSGCSSLLELQSGYFRFHSLYIKYRDIIASRNLEVSDLIVGKHVMGKSKDYIQNNSSKIILKKLESQNLNMTGGDKIEYIVFNSKAKDHSKRYISPTEFNPKKGYDVVWYCRELKRAFSEVVSAFMDLEGKLIL